MKNRMEKLFNILICILWMYVMGLVFFIIYTFIHFIILMSVFAIAIILCWAILYIGGDEIDLSFKKN